jgi:hypothetical protein
MMTALHAPANALAPRPTPLEVFTLRCWARVRLYADCELSLHEAVDELQKYAVESGLVSHIGQDAVQAILASEFGTDKC